MDHGYLKVAALTPMVHLCDCAANAAACAVLAREAAWAGVRLAVFPELCLTGATGGDLLAQSALLRGAMNALLAFAAETADLELVSVVGLPVAYADRIYDCAAVVSGGAVLGLVPRTHLGAEERRVFAPAPTVNLTYDAFPDGTFATLGTKQLFVCSNLPGLRLGVELGGDPDAVIPPSAYLSLAGATVIACPAARPELVSAEAHRRAAVEGLSARAHVGYILSDAGAGESSTDYAFGGHALIAECGDILAERAPFAAGHMTVTELDLERIAHDRRIGGETATAVGEYTESYFTILLEETTLTRAIDPHPFTPAEPAALAARCERILDIQSAGLARRASAAWAKKLVLGISGGLDSTLAILVMARALDLLGRPRTDIVAVTMPCFGTTTRTRSNATVLCEELGVDFRCVDIHAAVMQHFADIGHDPAVHDVVYENAQARERTQILMDIANEVGGLVVGTGDLSELALGWATYNGDHMSMYGVNAGLPKTLIRHVTRHVADSEAAAGHTALAEALYDILDTPVSPELLPADQAGNIAQKTEDLVGPYELHDFFLYHTVHNGYAPGKIFRMARYALGDTYDDATILHWLETFARRFFNQQFKRSCLADGPAIGSVGLSPRGAWRMPSDASAALWQAEIATLKATYLVEC